MARVSNSISNVAMNILAVIPYVPTPIRVRPYQLLRYLAQRGHRITLATVLETEAEQKYIDEIRGWGIEVIAATLTRQQKLLNMARAAATGVPLQAWFCQVPALTQAIQDRLAQGDIDIAHVEHLRGARYALDIQAFATAQHLSTVVVWDSVDCISHLFAQASQRSRSWKSKLMTAVELPRTRRYEGMLAAQFPQVLVTSDADAAALQKLARNHATIRTLGNGVDLDYFTPSHEQASQTTRQPDTVVFSGKMSYHANITAALYLAEEVMPLVWRSRPNVKLSIVGSQPTAQIRALEANEPGARIRVTGYVKDLRVPLRQASIAAAPLLYGAGIQNKVLEAMACGIPVVGSSQAFSALKVERGADCLAADTPAAFAEALLNLLNNEGLRQRMGAAGRRFVETHHNWHSIIAELESIYQSTRNPLNVQQFNRSIADDVRSSVVDHRAGPSSPIASTTHS